MSEHWTERLSEYLDGELPEAEVAGLEAHLAVCGACSDTLDELRAVVREAKALPDGLPERDLWPAIEAQLGPRGTETVPSAVVPIGRRPHGLRRRIMLTVPQLAAAGIALVLFSASGVWMALRTGSPPAVEEQPATAAVAPGATPFAYQASWDAAVADLEAEFERRRAVLDPATIQVVERNLAIIDGAIAESRRALEADPSSGFLNGYLVEAMRRKVDLLRQATRIQRTET